MTSRRHGCSVLPDAEASHVLLLPWPFVTNPDRAPQVEGIAVEWVIPRGIQDISRIAPIPRREGSGCSVRKPLVSGKQVRWNTTPPCWGRMVPEFGLEARVVVAAVVLVGVTVSYELLAVRSQLYRRSRDIPRSPLSGSLGSPTFRGCFKNNALAGTLPVAPNARGFLKQPFSARAKHRRTADHK